MPSFTSREVREKLRKYDKAFYFENGGGNGHQKIIAHPELGFMPIPDHGHKAISPHVLASIARKFKLPKNFFK